MAEHRVSEPTPDAEAFRSAFESAWSELQPVFEAMVKEKIASKLQKSPLISSNLDPLPESPNEAPPTEDFLVDEKKSDTSSSESNDSESDSDTGDAAVRNFATF
jgi:hypothetical protein